MKKDKDKDFQALITTIGQEQNVPDTIKEFVMVIAETLVTNGNDIRYLKKSVAQNTRDMTDVKEEYPLLPTESDDLQRAVKRKGVALMGGKKSNAYQDVNLRREVFKDIYREIKRQYGLIDERGVLLSYKKLKRKYLKGALALVEEHELSIVLQNEVDALNELEDLD